MPKETKLIISIRFSPEITAEKIKFPIVKTKSEHSKTLKMTLLKKYPNSLYSEEKWRSLTLSIQYWIPKITAVARTPTGIM
jgi:hypothetical protein